MRERHTYGERREWQAPAGYGLDVEQPVAGFYKVKFGKDAVRHAVRLVYGPPLDPITGEEMDRSWRWMAFVDDGTLANFDDVWPRCARDPITEQEFRRCEARTKWARQHAPDSAYADPRARHDPLSAPLPF